MAGIKRQAGARASAKRGVGRSAGPAAAKGNPAKNSRAKGGPDKSGATAKTAGTGWVGRSGGGKRDRNADRGADPVKHQGPPRSSKAAFQARQQARVESADRREREAKAGPSESVARREVGAGDQAKGRGRGATAAQGTQWPRFRSEPGTGPRTRQKSDAERPTAADPVVATPAAPAPKSMPVQTLVVTDDEGGMRLDRFLVVHVPGLPFSVQQRIVRKGEVRINGARAKPNARLEAGQTVRIPPVRFDVAPKERTDRPYGGGADSKIKAELAAMTLYEDDDVLVLNKPMGLAVQGGIGMTKHIDAMLGVLETPDGQRPRLVHRIDKDTAGCLLIAKTRFAASALTKTFRTRSARKVYWALVAGVPKVKQGRISTYLAKDEEAEAAGEAKMRVAKHGEDGAAHAVTYYAMVEHTGKICSWISLKPVTGRTHQLRAHMNHIGNPIIGDPKYFIRDNWELVPGMQNKLHLLARRIVVPHPRTGKPLDVTAPLPPHMLQSWNLLTLDADRYDPIEDAPE